MLVLALGCVSCARHDSQIQLHREALQSLRSTAHATVTAWLAGNVSGTFTRTALERTYLLVEQERTALAKRPEMLIDSSGAALSDSAEHLARLIALLMKDIRDADSESARAHRSALPTFHTSETQ
jgi:hypothetical protein